MTRFFRLLATIIWIGPLGTVLPSLSLADDSPPDAETKAASDSRPLTVEQIVNQVRPSLVTISTVGREGQEHGLGTGFVVSDTGLIATNLHVIGEGREFRVELSDGTNLPVVAVHASDRIRDLAVVQVERGDHALQPLPLVAAAELKQGEPIVLMGNPLGLKHSVVSGVVSALREVEGQEMIQLAVPIERGNSGGPVVDLLGRVRGIVNMKSLREENVGFAIDAQHLQSLLDQPNPIAIARWTTIGAIDTNQWTPLLGARWRQRAGRIMVSEPGAGFGGRSLCLSKTEPPELPYELAVSVKLNDEAGAAGLVFHSDGSDKNYGFYPTNGKLRLTCFQGPTVFAWTILQDVESEHYIPGEWNRLKVRVESDKLLCYVNDHLVLESRDQTYTSGKIGLAKFRETEAEFKNFHVAKELAGMELTSDEAKEFAALIDSLPKLLAVRPQELAPLNAHADAAQAILLRRADELQRRAEELRHVAHDVHVRGVVAELGKLAHGTGPNSDLDLLRAALWLAKLDERDIDVEAYVAQVDQMAGEIRGKLADNADEATRLAALTTYLFEENGFHGSRNEEYYHSANSYLNRVIDDREGIPVTLSVLFMELGKRLDLNIQGVGLPGHFVVKHVAAESEQLIDVFERGKLLTREEAAEIVRLHGQRDLTDADLATTPKLDILVRMISNLGGLAESQSDGEALLRYLEALVAIEPESADYRLQRARLRAYVQRLAAAVEDLDWLLEQQPEGLDLDRVHEMRDELLRRIE